MELNKQLIHAIANKISFRLQEIHNKKYKEFIDNYIPSESYKHLSTICNQLDSISSQIEMLNNQYNSILEQIREITGARFYLGIEKSLQDLKDKEFKFKIPSIQEIKDDVILYCIDGNISKVIDVLVEMYEHQGNN